MRGLVPRCKCIKYRGYDEYDNPIERITEGFYARIIQHEVDRLGGVLSPFRIEDLKDFGFEVVLLNKIYKQAEIIPDFLL